MNSGAILKTTKSYNSNAGFYPFFNQARDLFVLLSSQLTILEANPAVLKTYGKSKPASYFKGKQFKELFVADTKLCKLLRSLTLSNSKSKIAESIETITGIENRTILWKINKISNLKNNLIALVGQDLSAEKMAEQKAKDAHFSLETMIAHLPGNVYWMDKNCIHLGCNNNVLKMLGLTREQYVGKTYEELAKIAGWTKGEAESFKRDDLEVLRTGVPKFNVEEPPLRHVNGKVLYYLTTRVPMKNEAGEIVGVAGISIDITDRILAEAELKEAKERAEAAAEAKSQFLANITHDFITPLSIIMGGADAIAAHGDNVSKRLEYCNDIKTTANALLNDVQDILEVAQFNHKELPIRYEAFDIPDLISEIIRAFTLQASTKNIKINTEYSNKISWNLISDKHRIRRILNNLLTNAIKFTENGEITLKFLLIKQKNATFLSFSVSDTGIGIPKDKLKEIFEPFIRLKPSYHGHHKGIGLGLSIVREFIEQLGGKISVKSELGRGTTFNCEIPCVLPKSNTPVAISQEELAINKLPQKQTSIKLNHLKVLLVEDDPMIRKFTQMALMNFSCQIITANNAHEAIQLAGSNKFDLILLDIGLPDHDGIYVTQAIRKQEMKNHTTPTHIVALTAHVDAKQKQDCLKLGMDKFCKKPLTNDKFLKICEHFKLIKV